MIAKLEMLIALARTKHFGRAAEHLGITQPTLSAGIKQLEKQLGVQLVLRGSRFGGLTPEGKRALVWARQIVGDTRRLRDEMRFRREGLSGLLRIAVIPTALTWASRLAAEFNRVHPQVEFTILSRSSADILEMLENLDIDAGISYLDNEPLGRVSKAFLYTENHTLICPADHPLADRAELDWAEVGAQRLCLLTPDMQNRRIINKLLNDAGVAPVTGFESNSTVVLVSQVREAGLCAVLPEDLARFLTLGRDLRMIPIVQGEPGHSVGLVAQYHDPHTPVLQALLDVAAKLSRRHEAPVDR
ncbi:transcriptional regulator [Primorskyibacter sedentarius]|uniref:Transcriptional regulator n=1 Tax=Primorskyibacter sedentarius TaxID=745311 RepID=A0A4R3JIJ3_9RHOB|nr:LysR family transcriptional regulator [Primorskyibacter sedentarius]TCS65874.1 transcriptional regulator [Primorskyibacter sedentarius]